MWVLLSQPCVLITTLFTEARVNQVNHRGHAAQQCQRRNLVPSSFRLFPLVCDLTLGQVERSFTEEVMFEVGTESVPAGTE